MKKILFVILLCIGVISVQAQELKHSYTFEDGAATDVVGGANGTPMGAGTFADGAYTAAAKGDYIELPAADIAINTYSAITLEAYITADVDNTDATMLAFFGETVGSFGANYLFMTPDRWSESRAGISCGNTDQPWTAEEGVTGAAVTVGSKHYVVTVITSETLSFYIDGKLVGTTPVTNSIADISTSLAYIGKGGYTGDPTWVGTVHEFNIYDGAMTASDILTKAKAEGLVKVIGYINVEKEMPGPGAAQPANDPIIKMLSADPHFVVDVQIVAADAVVDLSGYDVVIAQEGFSSSSAIFQPGGSLGLASIPVPFIYNKSYAFKAGRGLGDGAAGSGKEDEGVLTIDVAEANQTNPLFNGITFVDNTMQLVRTGADDNGGGTRLKAYNYGNGVELSDANTVLGMPTGAAAEATIGINDIPMGTTIGTETTIARMISIGMNFGAICKKGGLNLNANGLTLWRNAAYILAGLDVPETPVAEPVADKQINVTLVTDAVNYFDTATVVALRAWPQYNVSVLKKDVIEEADLETLNAADVVIMGRGINSSNVGSGMAVWDMIQKPVISMNMWGLRGLKDKAWWTPNAGAANVVSDGDTLLKATLLVTDDPVISYVTDKTELNWWNGPFSVFNPSDSTDAGNGVLLAITSDARPLYMRWDPFVEFYPGAGHKPMGYRSFIGCGNDNTDLEGSVNYFGFTPEATDIFLGEVDRMAALEIPVEPEPVIFDPATVDPATLPEGMSIVQMDGVSYLQVVVNGWNSTLPIPEFPIAPITGATCELKYTLGPDAANTLDKVNAAVQLMDTIRQIPNPWDANGAPAASSTSLSQSPADGTMATVAGNLHMAIRGINQLQFFGQSTSDWAPTVGDTIWVGKIMAVEVDNDPVVYNPLNVLAGDAAPEEDDLSADIITMWDEKNIYISVNITDQILDNSASNSWERDLVEIYFDMDNAKTDGAYDDNDHQLTFIWNTDNSAVLDTLALSSQRDTEDGWVLDVTIPWSALMDGFTPAVGTTIGFDVHVGDNDTGGSRDNKLSWMTLVDQAWNNPSYMGELTLLEGGFTEPIYITEPNTLTINIDVTPLVDAGLFTAGTDKVGVAGSFNEWSTTASPATDEDGDNIYTLVLSDIETGTAIEYKTVINEGWDISDAPNGGPNRTYTVVEGDNVIDIVFNDGDVTPFQSAIDDFGVTTFSMYPNPAKGVVTINAGDEAISNVTLFDITGKAVVTKSFNTTNATLDINSVPAGMYFIKVQVNGNTLTNKLIVK